jgi:proline dehydrogenase
MIDFTNTEVAFKMKTKNDLRQSKLLFATLSSPQVVQTLKGLTLASLFLKLPIKGIVKATVFRQFCGGESVEECQPQIDRLAEGNVQAILDYSVEGKAEEADFDRTLETTLDTIRFAQNNPGVPFGVFKPTGVGAIEWYEKVSLKQELSAEESESWARVLARWEKIFMLASEMKIPVMIDAEESWIQPVVDELAFGFMAKYNTQTPIVYNTAQLYRHDRLEQLKMALARAKEEGFIYGVKIVRGAYMEKERKRAEAKGYTDPIQPNKAATDRDYNAALELILSHIDYMTVVVGTHNEDSVALTATLMRKHGIAFDSRKVYVAQLFGMSDHISFNAANSGLNVAKYLPFGPVKDVLPYLFRRAEENTAVEGQTGRELGLLTKELDRRKNA